SDASPATTRPRSRPWHDDHGRAGTPVRGARHLVPGSRAQPRPGGRRSGGVERGAVPRERARPRHGRHRVVSGTAAAAPVVYKFGGTSVAGAERIRDVARLVAEGPRPLVVVVSAMAGVTNRLQQLASMDAPAPDE